MQAAYPELAESADRVARVIRAEEQRFGRTLHWDRSSSIPPSSRLSSRREDSSPTLQGATAFHLYETYGLPLDFIADAARDQGIDFDLTGFELARAEEQARARASWKGGSKASASPAFRELPKTLFEGYRQLTSQHCEVLAIVRDGNGVPQANAGESVEIVLDHTSSTPTPAARWGIPAGSTLTTTTPSSPMFWVAYSRCRASVRTRSTCVSPSSWAIMSMPWWIQKHAQRFAATIPAPTCCTPPCAKFWAST